MSLEHRWRSAILLGIASALVITGTACQKEETKKPDPIAGAFAEFDSRLGAYMALRKRLVADVGELDPTSSQEKIAARANGLAQAIIAARASAKQGDIFTPEISSIIATLIKEEYSRRADTVIDVRDDTQAELPDFKPEVNQVYPTSYPLATFPPTLLPILPTLPEQIEYRIVQKYLILRDVEANVILDFMPNAVPWAAAP